MMILRCLAVLLILASGAQAALVSDEQPVSELTLGPMTDWETKPRVATSGDESLVVWKGRSDVKMVRIDRSGVPLDDSPLVVPGPSSASTDSAVDVVWDGARYVIYDGWLVMISRAGGVESVNQIDDNPGASATIVAVSSGYLIADSSLGVMKVDREGHVLARTDPSSRCAYRCRPFVSARSFFSASANDVHLATSGLDVMMVWHLPNGGAFARQISIDGGAIGPLITLGSMATAANVTWTGQQYLFVWNDSFGLWVQAPSSSSHLLYSGFVQYPALASDGSSILVIWKESVSNNSFARAFGFFAMRITLDLQPGTRVEIDPMSDSSGRYFALQPPAIAAAPGRFFLAWTHGFVTPTSWFDDVYALSAAEGDLLTSQWNLLSRRARPQRNADIAIGGGTTWTAWSEELEYATRTRIRIAADGGIRDVNPIDDRQDMPAIASNGVDAFLAWSEVTGIQSHAMTARVDRNGNGLMITDLGLGAVNDVACGSADCLVIWWSSDALMASQIAPNGALLGTIVLAPGRTFARAAWNGNAYLIVGNTDVFLVRDGAVVRREVIEKIGIPDVASDGKTWVAVGLQPTTVWAIHFDASGTPGPAREIGDYDGPRIVWTGRDYLVAFYAGGAVKARQLDSNAVPIADAFVVAPGGNRPVLASGGDGTAVILYELLRSDRPYFNAPRVYRRTIIE